MDIIGRLWETSPLFLTREEFERSLDGWEIDPVYGVSGEVIGVFLVKGPDFHYAKFDPNYQVGRDILRRYPGELITRHGYATTKTPKDDTRQQRFNERLGFYRMGEDEYDVLYRIDKLRLRVSASPSKEN
jgi:hypothetical protein